MILAALFALAAPATQPAPDYPATNVYTRQLEVIAEMHDLYPNTEVSVRWQPCGEENAWYDPENHSITLCTEMEKYPDAAVGVAAHEMAHAIEDQYLDYTSEQDADELAALCLIKLHKPSAALAAGQWLRGLDDGTHEPGDPHPGTAFRLWEMTCIVDGALGEGPASCGDLYRGLVLRYDQRLATP